MGEKVRIGIQAPSDVPVFRTEIYLEIRRDRGSTHGGHDDHVCIDVEQALRELGGEADQPSAR